MIGEPNVERPPNNSERSQKNFRLPGSAEDLVELSK
jgi:hypothetical protein